MVELGMGHWQLIPGYQLRVGSGLERSLLVKFLQRTYRELYPKQNFGHLADTVEEYFSKQTPLWWVEVADSEAQSQTGETSLYVESLPTARRSPVGCLWMGNAIDQVRGDRHAHIFLLYVAPKHRRRGIGSALMGRAREWARERGDRQITVQVFVANKPAIELYASLGYQPYSILMVKSL